MSSSVIQLICCALLCVTGAMAIFSIRERCFCYCPGGICAGPWTCMGDPGANAPTCTPHFEDHDQVTATTEPPIELPAEPPKCRCYEFDRETTPRKIPLNCTGPAIINCEEEPKNGAAKPECLCYYKPGEYGNRLRVPGDCEPEPKVHCRAIVPPPDVFNQTNQYSSFVAETFFRPGRKMFLTTRVLEKNHVLPHLQITFSVNGDPDARITHSRYDIPFFLRIFDNGTVEATRFRRKARGMESGKWVTVTNQTSTITRPTGGRYELMLEIDDKEKWIARLAIVFCSTANAVRYTEFFAELFPNVLKKDGKWETVLQYKSDLDSENIRRFVIDGDVFIEKVGFNYF